MTMALPPLGPAPADRARGERLLSRRMIRELARIYLSASAYTAALEALAPLGPIGPEERDEEAKLLCAEALIGLGRVPEAEALLGAPMLPDTPPPDPSAPASPKGSPKGERRESEPAAENGVLPRVAPGHKPRTPGRSERIALWRFLLQMRILHRTGRYRFVLGLGRAFFLSRQLTPNIYLARIASVVAQSMLALRQPAEARALYEEILELYRGLRSTEGQADTLLGMANTQMLDCHWDQADALYQEARFRYEEMGHSDKALACLINLGVLRGKRGDLSSGRMLLQQALTRCAQIGDTRRVTTVRLGLAMIEIRAGEFSSARGRLLAVLRTARRNGHARNRALALEFLGSMYLYQHRFTRARRCLSVGLRIARDIAPEGDVYFEIRRLQAELAVAERSLVEARVLAVESQNLARAFGDEYEAAVADRVLAEVEAAEGKIDTARARVQEARKVLRRLGETYEKARLDLVQLRLDLKTGGLPAGSIRERLEEACRPFAELPDAPVVREARRILSGSGWNVSAVARSLGVSRSALRRSLTSREWMHSTRG